jgi:hypothetical protein
VQRNLQLMNEMLTEIKKFNGRLGKKADTEAMRGQL